MSLSDFSTIASLISSAGVAISVIYLALQVRQAESNQRALMQQGRATRAHDASLRLAEPQFSAVFNKTARAPKELAPAEIDQYMLICRAAFLSAEDSVLQYKAGLLEETAYQSFLAGLWGLFGQSPGMRAAWPLSAHQYGPDFAAVMNEAARHRPLLNTNVQAQWTELVDAEMAETSAAP